MKKIILFFALGLFLSQTKAQYVDKASVIQSINNNVKRAPATPLRGDTLNAILKGIMSFAGGSSTPFLFGINDVAMGQDRYMDMSGGKNWYFDYDGNRDGNNYLQFSSGGLDIYYVDTAIGAFQGKKSSEIYTDKSTLYLDHFVQQLGRSRIDFGDSSLKLYTANNRDNSTIVQNGNNVTIKRSNDNIAKNIITSVNSAVADSTGNINIAAGGAPMRFGIDDTIMMQDRRISMAHQAMTYDFDGDQSGNNNILFGGSGQKDDPFYYDLYLSKVNNYHIFSSEIIGKAEGIKLLYAYDSSQNLISFDRDSMSLSSSIIQNGTTSKTEIKLKGTLATLAHSNDNIAKNIITSVNNQLADSTGNINTPTFTIAQRNALPIPSAGFTAFIIDAVARDGSVGVNQSWNGTMWKNNW